MAKPCAVFWDIQNVGIPKGQSVNSIINLIRSTIIKPHNLDEIFFFCVCDVHKLPSNVGQSLTNLDVDIVQAYNGVKDSADIKILDIMRKFVKFSGQDCSIILLSGDADYYGTLSDLKKLHNISIHLIRLANAFSPKLDQISDYTFILNDGVLKPIKSTGAPKYFISVNNYPLTMDINFVMATLNSQIAESIQSSAILFDEAICIGFPTLWNAEKAIEKFNGSRFHGMFLKVELIVDSPLTEILKCLKPNVTMKTKRYNKVKQLTFIKMINSNEADQNKIIKYCIACTKQSGSQCILSRKSYLWIVFSFKSDATKFLPKIQIIYPDAVISEPPIDLTLAYRENPYTVESCKIKVADETRSNIAASKPEKVAFSQNQSSSNASCADVKPEEANESVTLEKSTKTESSNAVSLDNCDDSDSKIFFRFNSNSIAPVLHYQLTKWSLLYNLFEKLYDLGAKNVIFDGNLYCAHFDSASAYQDALAQMGSRYLEPLQFVPLSKIPNQQEVKKKMDRYNMEFLGDILGNRECIFIKSTPGEIWIGFPNELICVNSAILVLRLASLKYPNDLSTHKPSIELLESVDFEDLVGDAYDLAFLSSQLESSRSIQMPQIMEKISLHRRTRKQEGNETVFSINVKGNFRNLKDWVKLSLGQIVKIFVKLSKVIPVAATASYDEVNLMFDSWYEAFAAHHFINHLTSTEVPYFTEFNGASEVQQQQLAFPSIFKYYIINDKRKVLEKIVENKSLGDRQLEMNLAQMDCQVCGESEDKILVAVGDLEKGKKAKAKIDQIKFKMLYEKDDDDYEVGVTMQSGHISSTELVNMTVNKYMDLKKSLINNTHSISDVVPLDHFNYSYRKAVGMAISEYCKLNKSDLQNSSHNLIHLESIRVFRAGSRSDVHMLFAKVIPIAGIASMTQVDFVFNSWVEAATACHFINNLRYDEVCCLQPRMKASLVEKSDAWFTTREFYIINDQRKVLEKIIQTKNGFNETDATSTMVNPVQDSKPWLKIGYTVYIEFEDKIWVEVEDLVKGHIPKVRMGNLQFKLLHENDEHDLTIGGVVEERINYMDQIPLCVALMVCKRISSGEQIKSEKPSATNGYIHPYVPLGYFNYCHREAVGIKPKKYCNSDSQNITSNFFE
uniref:NYN domain-containing protein n=1 Tax=Tetranychus urticae TaxID=32264 RepID=T1KGH5_TETUR